MDLKRLRYFREIAEHGQITKAAKKLHMAQPPLSQQLRLFEDELGVTLFERTGRRLLLTEAGEALYRKSERILEELGEVEREVRETGKGLKGTLRIGVVKSCFASLPKQMNQYHSSYPDVTFSIREGDTYAVGELVKSKEVDIGFVRLPIDLHSFDTIHLTREPFVVAMSESFAIGKERSITLDKLSSIPLLLLHRISGAGQYELVLQAFKEKGIQPTIFCECPDVTILLSLVSNGMGATIVPASTLHAFHTPHIRTFDIDQTEIFAESALIWLKDRYLSKAARHFIELFATSKPEKVI